MCNWKTYKSLTKKIAKKMKGSHSTDDHLGLFSKKLVGEVGVKAISGTVLDN
jgi:hypothetical protein